MEKKLLGEYLKSDHLIDEQQLQRALAYQADQSMGGNMPLIGTVLIHMGAVNEDQVRAALQHQDRDRNITPTP